MNLSPLAVAALVVPALAVATVVPAAPALSDPAPTCLGQPATIVATRHQNVVGTAGPDVIVATDPRRIDAGAGDDLVCATFTEGRYVKIFLGAGADRYVGSGDLAMMSVDTGDHDDVALGRAPSHDEVTTSGASDEVHTGVQGFVDDDIVDEGSGGDSLTIAGLPEGSFTAALPPADESNTLVLHDPGQHAWQIDEEAGTVSIDHGPPTRLSGFDDLRVSRLTWASLDVTGTDRSDYVDATGPVGTRGPLTARLGGGPDSIDLDGTQTGSVDLGAGHTDQVLINGLHAKSFEGDLAARLHGTWSLDGRSGVTLAGVEKLSTYGFLRAGVTGTSARNYLSLSGCGGWARGGAGHDLLTVEFDRGCPHQTTYSLYGGPGDDRLFGSGSSDLLIGGPGRDVACPGGGRDKVRVERVLPNC